MEKYKLSIDHCLSWSDSAVTSNRHSTRGVSHTAVREVKERHLDGK